MGDNQAPLKFNYKAKIATLIPDSSPLTFHCFLKHQRSVRHIESA